MKVEHQESSSTNQDRTWWCCRFGEGGARSLEPDTLKAEGIDGVR